MKEKWSALIADDRQEGTSARVNSVQMLNALVQKDKGIRLHSLLYVDMKINGHAVRAMVDTGAMRIG